MIEVTGEGKVIYKTGDNRLGRFPEAASEDLVAGPKRNFQVFDPLDFLAEVTQHPPSPRRLRRGKHCRSRGASDPLLRILLQQEPGVANQRTSSGRAIRRPELGRNSQCQASPKAVGGTDQTGV